jgi:hypothetical protein
MSDEQKYVVVSAGQRVTGGLTEEEAKKKAEELRKRLEENNTAPEVSVKQVLLG